MIHCVFDDICTDEARQAFLRIDVGCKWVCSCEQCMKACCFLVCFCKLNSSITCTKSFNVCLIVVWVTGATRGLPSCSRGNPCAFSRLGGWFLSLAWWITSSVVCPLLISAAILSPRNGFHEAADAMQEELDRRLSLGRDALKLCSYTFPSRAVAHSSVPVLFEKEIFLLLFAGVRAAAGIHT